MLSRKYLAILFCSLSLALLIGCNAASQSNPIAQETISKPVLPTAAPFKPYSVSILVGDKSVAEGDLTLAWQVMHFGEMTTIVYSLSGVDPATPPDSLSPQLTNEKGEVIKLIHSDILAQLDGVQIGQFTFDAVPRGTQNLQLAIQSKEMEKPLSMTLAKFQAASDESFGGSIYAYDDIAQGLYRISPNGFGLIKGDRVAQAQAQKGQTDQDLENERATRRADAKNKTPLAGMPPTRSAPTPGAAKLELAGVKRVVQDATLLIQELNSGKVQYLYFVILEDGEVRAKLLD